jgi:putative transposase
MYRLLEQAGEVRERRDQLRHPNYQKPQLLATSPNQVWSWDITNLLGPVKWTYFYLYVILDIFSRYVVGWMVAERESAELAKRLIGETCCKQNIVPDQLNIHADRGTSMTSKPVAPCCWPTWVSPRLTVARTSPMTTRSRKASSRL